MKEYIFYGALGDYIVGKRAECYVYNMGDVFLGYCDSNPMKWDLSKKIYSPKFISNHPDATIVVLCAAVKNVVDFLRKNNFNNPIMSYPHFRYTFLYGKGRDDDFYSCQWIRQNKKKLLDIYELNDETTKRILAESISQRYMTDFQFIEPKRMYGFENMTYFSDSKLIPLKDVTLIDCGAFTGDSIEDVYNIFRSHLKLVYAYEPDMENLNQLYETLRKLGIEDKVICFQGAAYDTDGKICFSSTNSMFSHTDYSGDTEINSYTIDNTVQRIEGKICIKMDVEGSELSVLRGARNVIKKYHPYMAICVYHKVEDILEIPQYIKSISDKYKFYLRAGCHLECYAIPDL